MNRTSFRPFFGLNGLFAVLLPVSLFAVDPGPTETPASPETVSSPAASSDIENHRAEIDRLWNDGRRGEARRLVKKWRKEDRESPWSWIVEGELLFREKRYKAAVARLGKALELAPQNAEAYYWRGRAYEAMKKPLDAANEYRASMMAGDSNLQAREALERVLAGLKPSES